MVSSHSTGVLCPFRPQIPHQRQTEHANGCNHQEQSNWMPREKGAETSIGNNQSLTQADFKCGPENHTNGVWRMAYGVWRMAYGEMIGLRRKIDLPEVLFAAQLRI